MLFTRLLASCGVFGRNRGGNVAPIFALSLLPMAGMVGAAVDYSRANSTRTSLLSALDATALMLSRDAPNLAEGDLKTKAKAYFQSLFTNDFVKAPPNVNVSFTTPQQGSFKLVVTADAAVNANFARLLGTDEMRISASSEVAWGMKRLEVALALDNTGSMAWSNKMVEMKKAVKSLLDTLHKAAKKPDDVKVAIIPFDTTVRIDQDHTAVAPWVTFDHFTKNKNTWIGCIADRDYLKSYDVTDVSPNAAIADTLFPAAECSANGALEKMRPLTSDWQALDLTVNGMSPNGATNVTIGLVWAWHALTANMPLNQAAAPQPDLDKVIILLTDGENTRNRFTTNTGEINLRTTAVCNNIRAANIKLYTIRVIEGNAALLKNCATKADMYFDVKQASQLNTVFSAIAQNLANLRVAK